MKLALLSDIHANLHALDACIAHAQAQGATRFAVLGDSVGYGAFPAQTLDRIMALVDGGGLAILGNHDLMALSPPAHRDTHGQQTAAWTHDRLKHEHLAFLRALPHTARVGPCWLVHASADAPIRWRYVDNEMTAQDSLDAACQHDGVHVVLGGHVHHQRLYYQGHGGRLMAFSPADGVAVPTPAHRRWLATVGSVGQPRDGSPAAMYALFDLAGLALTFHRVRYDHSAAAAAVRSAGLPESLAERLETGQ